MTESPQLDTIIYYETAPERLIVPILHQLQATNRSCYTPQI